MELEIQIIRDPCRDVSKERVRLFGAGGGNIGRSPDSHWALPDPKCYVSGHHCEIEFHDDAFWVRDTSRNGVFVNDATTRVGYGHRVRLGDGDRLRLGLYELIVRLRDHGRLVSDRYSEPAGTQDDRFARTVNLPSAGINHHASLQDAPGQTSTGGSSDATTRGAEPEPDRARALAPHSPELAKSDTGSHRLVKFDHLRLREIGLLPPESEERLIANQFRQIKRALLANAFGKGVPAVENGRLIMMTSALPGEGKTFSTINLAVSMSREKGVEVLIVDADVAKPQVSGLFGLQGDPGLLEALMDDGLDIESLVLRTDVHGLSILPAGRCAEDVATELLASARMEETVARLAATNPNRIVIFDSPPLLLTNESRVLTTVVGQVVLVVRAGATPQQAVIEAIGYVGGEKPTGLVLNQSKATGPSNYYGYGEYGYGQYGTDRDGSKSA